jgi:hypothetical protein
VDEVLRARSARTLPNGRARASLLVGALAVASVPAALALAAYSSTVDLKEAAVGVPLAFVLGVVAIALSRNARRVSAITLGRVGGGRTARVGSILGAIGVYLALTCGLAVAFFGVLLLFE